MNLIHDVIVNVTGSILSPSFVKRFLHYRKISAMSGKPQIKTVSSHQPCQACTVKWLGEYDSKTYIKNPTQYFSMIALRHTFMQVARISAFTEAAPGRETPTSFLPGHTRRRLLHVFEQSEFHIRTERVMYDRVTDLL